MHITDEETRLAIRTEKLSAILSNQVDYTVTSKLVARSASFKPVATRFSSANNYLWAKCHFFAEIDESFYARFFVGGKFVLGKQAFIEKANQTILDSVEVINTQAAFLLADLNDLTQVQYI